MKWTALLGSLLLASTISACSTVDTAGSGTRHAVVLDGHRYRVELATTRAAREHGLMERSHLPANEGMLFIFARPTPLYFWMKNTWIALDILYFDSRRRLVAMHPDVPPCTASPCPVYPSTVPAQYALELPAGTAARIGVRRGDQLVIEGRIGRVER